jgi:hypothetical protein
MAYGDIRNISNRTLLHSALNLNDLSLRSCFDPQYVGPTTRITGEGKYIVYAKMVGDDLQTSKCTGTGLLKNAESRIDFLDELRQKKNRRGDKS